MVTLLVGLFRFFLVYVALSILLTPVLIIAVVALLGRDDSGGPPPGRPGDME